MVGHVESKADVENADRGVIAGWNRRRDGERGHGAGIELDFADVRPILKASSNGDLEDAGTRPIVQEAN